MSKQRKPQLEEEYEKQKQQFYSEGPTINNEDELFNQIDDLDMSKKSDRNQILYIVQRCYYSRDYTKCLHFINQALAYFDGVVSNKVDKQYQELLDIKQNCEAKLNQ